MSAVTSTRTAATPGTASDRLTGTFVRWLETGVRPDDLFAEDVFADLTVPHWRVQASGPDAAFHLREDSHPYAGQVVVHGLDRTSRGFLLELEERWAADGQQWHGRELIHCVVAQDRVTELRVYCCGDWDEALQQRHADQVHLLRP